MTDKLNWGLFSKYRTELYGAATIMIMIFHSQIAITLPGILSYINKHFNYGVDIFLLLSGICLYFSFSKNNDYGNFIKKRCERTLIPYLIIGFFYWVWRYIFAEFSILDFIYNASGLSLILTKYENYLTLGEPLIWYVAFIMAMYLLYPLIYKVLYITAGKNRIAVFAALLVFSVGITLFLRSYASEAYNNTEVFITRIPVFLIGCYLGKAVKDKQKFRICDYIMFFMFIPAKLFISFILKSNNLMLHRYLGFLGAFIICFVLVFILEAVSNIKFIIIPVKKVLGFFGSLSLEIYIIHVLLYNALLYYIPDIKSSDVFAYREKAGIYLGILIISTILGFIFNKVYNAILSKKKAVA